MAFGIKFAQHISAENDIRLKIGGVVLWFNLKALIRKTSQKFPQIVHSHEVRSLRDHIPEAI
jgi:hypothetical protein